MNILTFDIEDWFHVKFEDQFCTDINYKSFESRVEASTDFILDTLDEFRVKATFLCLGWIAQEYPNLIKRIHSRGHEIGSHSHMHRLLYTYSPDECRNDLRVGLQLIEDLTGEKVEVFRAPAFSIVENSTWIFEELIRLGVKIDLSLFSGKRDFGGMNDLNITGPTILETKSGLIKELPTIPKRLFNYKTVPIGGGYFRLLPRWIIDIMMSSNEYNMLYFHPRDFDRYQPRLKDMKMNRYFKSYYGLSNSKQKFQRLIQNYDFHSVSKANNEIIWDQVPLIKV